MVGLEDRLCGDYTRDFPQHARATTDGVLKQILSLPQNEKNYLLEQRRKAVAFAVFPNARRQGVMGAALYGKGILAYKDAKGRWSSPVPLTLQGQSMGPQFGVQSSNIIFTFSTVGGLKDFLRGHHHIQTSGSRTLIEHVGHKADPLAIKVHAFDHGVMMGQSLDSYSIHIDDMTNARLYGVRLKPGCIVEGTRSGFRMPWMLRNFQMLQQPAGQAHRVMHLY